jgi:hypothetical protein
LPYKTSAEELNSRKQKAENVLRKSIVGQKGHTSNLTYLPQNLTAGGSQKKQETLYSITKRIPTKFDKKERIN